MGSRTELNSISAMNYISVARTRDSHVPCNTLIKSSLCESKYFVRDGHGDIGFFVPGNTHTRNAAARCCLRYNLSSSKLSNLGYDLILSFLPETVFPRAPTLALPVDSLLRVVAAGAMAVEWTKSSLILQER